MDSGDHITVEMRLAAIEEKLDRVLAHLDLDDDPGLGLDRPVTAVGRVPGASIETDPQFTALIQAGKKIQAIKAYRQATGAGLKAAKEAVDAMERSMQVRDGRR